jgi:hypothetical protein
MYMYERMVRCRRASIIYPNFLPTKDIMLLYPSALFLYVWISSHSCDLLIKCTFSVLWITHSFRGLLVSSRSAVLRTRSFGKHPACIMRTKVQRSTILKRSSTSPAPSTLVNSIDLLQPPILSSFLSWEDVIRF